MSIRSKVSGLYPEEQYVVGLLGQAWNAFLQLSSTDSIPEANRPDEITEFRQAIHRAEQVLLNRIVSRDYPDFWN